MEIVGKVTIKKVFAYNFLYTNIKNDYNKFYELQEKGKESVKLYVEYMYRRLLNITNRATLADNISLKDIEIDVHITKRSGKKFIIIEMLKAREIHGVTHIGIVLDELDYNEMRYFVKLNKHAYLNDVYGNLIEIISSSETKMITMVEDYSNEKLINSLANICCDEPLEIKVPSRNSKEDEAFVSQPEKVEITEETNATKFDEESLKAAKIYYINNWISKENNRINIFDICDTSDRNEITFFAKILNNKFFDYKNVQIEKMQQVVECKRCGITPCPINTFLNVSKAYPNTEFQAFGMNAVEKLKIENADEKLDFIEEFDILSLHIAEFLIKNKLVHILSSDDEKINFEMAELEEEIEENEKISPIRIIRDFSENIIDKKEATLKIKDIGKIKKEYNICIKNNPYLLSAYILYKMNKENMPMVYFYERINSEKNIEKARNELKLRISIEKINKLYLEDISKTELIKMLEYARRFSEGEVTTYIPFNMRIYCDNEKILTQILDIMTECFSYFKYITNKERIIKSFHSIYDYTSVEKLYENAKYAYIVLKEVDALENQDKLVKERILNELKECILKNVNSTITIIADITKKKIDDALVVNSMVKDKIFDYELYTRSATENEVYQELINEFEIDYEMDNKFKAGLLKYINATYSKRNVSYAEYISATYERICFNKGNNNILTENLIPEYEKEKSIEDIFAELNELVGLQNVKQMLTDLTDLIEFKTKTNGMLKLKDTNLHMVFLGNPGTGKTTVARLIAGILYNLKYIRQNKLVEVSAKDLVAKYVGQTAPKTMEIVEKALGGVLFVDEAYSLASKEGDEASFNAECVATLIQAMENYRDDLVVIFAGYKKEMQGFLDSNSGIVSRIGYTMNFEDYTTDELIQIFKSMVGKAGFEVEDAAIEEIKDIINEHRENKNFGNARFVRNLYEKIVIKHATNMKKENDENKLKTITVNDISADSMFSGNM